MATATKKKTKSIGQVSYLTKQVASLEKELVRKDIEKLDQKVDGVKTELSNKIERLDQKVDNLENKVDTKIDNLENKIDWLKWLVGGGLTALLSIMLYLHSDTKQDINSINTKLDKLIERDLRK